MVIIFTSECKDKALKRTKQTLDLFALRIGRRTWKTVITEDGLLTIRKLLRKNASKNTCISCYRVKGYNEMNLLWSVGNKDYFNNEGVFPVNYKNKTNNSNDWHYLDLIKCLVAIASLFHDFVKASIFFQEKLKRFEICGDPMRHDWLSAILFISFTKLYKEDEWIDALINSSSEELESNIILSFKNADKSKISDDISDLVLSISWLIMTHHKLPIRDPKDAPISAPLNEFKDFLKIVSVEWGYKNDKNEDVYEDNLKKCFEFNNGLPISDIWLKYVKRYANKLKKCQTLFDECLKKDCLRSILTYSRLCIVLGDHTFSSKDNDKNWKGKSDLFANSYRNKKELKQKLDEHLIGVSDSSTKIAHLLSSFEGNNYELPYAKNIKFLSLKSPKKFEWQDIAVDKIREWRKEKNNFGVQQFGFFGVNVASTGKGKTIANAKLMKALSINGDTLRYIFSVGLRTLTFQTGSEYKKKLDLSNEELAIVVGGTLINSKVDDLDSDESLIEDDIEFYDESFVSNDHLSTLLVDNKSKAFLYAPVLCCTIDHIIKAVERTKGGKNILPFLRLMSSDLIIDEIDDFSNSDLIPIGRLIHLAGMLGRKVIISSATITPDIVEGYYTTYKYGWSQFAKFREVDNDVACAFIDEFTTEIHNI